ncbi:uncharacterized protein LOC115881067 [Sitophilus oryzae]|uniref:Uncharacterized protein LOC115881067 n=1 Tax=Sitophilus oryzae TaxID=7048 RepID=A0A6J2XS51_SITOR|nr:uncharacterized protein LOC115881067 [Sitophilus oryzae]
MEIQENETEVPATSLNRLDSALSELGMLAASTNSRQEYLTEIRTKNYLNMLTINTRYVSNVSIGFQVRPSTPHVRYKPYNINTKERHRTRSENNDAETSSLAQKLVEDCITDSIAEISQLKKAKSLESVIAESGQSKDLSNISFGELEQVSDGVQKLKVVE